jgi:hypothetical protein
MSSSAGRARRLTAEVSISGGLKTRGWPISEPNCNRHCRSTRRSGRTLARAHARAGDPALVSGYVGKGRAFDEAISTFAVAYADQTETDWNGFLAAIKAGRIVAAEPEKKKR